MTSKDDEPEQEISEREERMSKKLYPSLSDYEISFYIASWCFGVILVLYNLYRACLAYSKDLYMVDMVPTWWKINQSLGRQDVSDHEWMTWKRASQHVGFLVVVQIVISQVIKRSHSHRPLLLSFAVSYSVIVSMYLLGVYPTLYLFLQIIIIFLASFTNSALFVWFCAISYVLAQNYYPLNIINKKLFPTYDSQMYESYLTSVTSAWINARCVSYSLDRIWGDVSSDESAVTSFAKLTSYCFYLPTGVMGPLITYKKYHDSLWAAVRPLDRGWLRSALLQSFRYLLWFCVTDISLYFFYQQSLALHPNIVNSLNLWALCGMGYFLGQFFHLKYVVMYGWSSHLARLDDVDAPPHPKCIGRIHLYSDMWRYFDNGLYIFIQKYLYLPLLSKMPGEGLAAKLVASIICFSFIYVWHGTMEFVFIWSCLNFVGITCEAFAKAIGNTQRFKSLENSFLSPRGKRRFYAAVATPLFIMSALSNFYFFAGIEVGNIFARRVLLEMWPRGFPTLLFFMYCCSQTSMEVKNYELRKEISGIRNLKE
jgi:hypothetical protein